MMMVETAANLRLLAGSFASEPELLRSGSIAGWSSAIATPSPKSAPSCPPPSRRSCRPRGGARRNLSHGRRACRHRARCGAGPRPGLGARDGGDRRARRSGRSRPRCSCSTRSANSLALIACARPRATCSRAITGTGWRCSAWPTTCPASRASLPIAAIRHAQAAKASPAGIDREAARGLVEAWIAPRKGLADRLMQPMSAFDQQGGWSLAKLVLLGDAVREFVYACRDRDCRLRPPVE